MGEKERVWVNGTNYENYATTRPDPANERGSWRVEVSPKIASTQNYFLNVIQVMDNDSKSKLDVKLIEGNDVIGVHLANRVITFSKDAQTIDHSFSFTIQGTQTIKIMDNRLVTWHLAGNKR